MTDDWKRGYVAGLVDNHSSIVVAVAERTDRRIGYNVTTECRIKLPAVESTDLVTELCDANGITYRTKERSHTKYGGYEIVIGSRDALQAFLRQVQPYLVVRDEAVELLTDTIIPRLNDGDHQQKASFIDLMTDIDRFRDLVGRANRSKYDAAYFEEMWDVGTTSQ